jgi:hypothetical protein
MAFLQHFELSRALSALFFVYLSINAQYEGEHGPTYFSSDVGGAL